MDGIEEAGGIPIILSFSGEEDIPAVVGLCDGILLTGGQDVEPGIYGEEIFNETVKPCEKRDRLEVPVFREAMKQHKPILGICRGNQLINACLGGTLYQDLPSQHPSDINHRQTEPNDRPTHTVSIKEGSPLDEYLMEHGGPESYADGKVLHVNTYHHQGIKDLAESLEAMAVSPDGLVEAVYLPEYPFLWGIQWHPELMHKTDETSKKIFKAFLGAML